MTRVAHGCDLHLGGRQTSSSEITGERGETGLGSDGQYRFGTAVIFGWLLHGSRAVQNRRRQSRGRERCMQVLLVNCHPRPESFCAALRDAAVLALETAGHSVEV